jgi:methyl-accepting chemotaxis protein
MSIRIKILLGCLGLTLLTALFGIFTQATERNLGDLAVRIYDEAFMAVSYLRSAQNGFSEAAVKYRALIEADHEQAPKAAVADAATGTPETYETLAAALATVLEDMEVAKTRAMSEEGRRASTALSDEITKFGDGLRSDRRASLLPMADHIRTQFDTTVEIYAGDGFRYRKNVGKMVDETVRDTWLVIAASVIIAIVITMLLSRSIVPPVTRALRVAKAIADGRLDNEIVAAGRSETAELLRALATMQSAIAENLSRIKGLLDEQERDHAGQARRQEGIDQLVSLFGRGMSGVFRTVSDSAVNMSRIAADLARSSVDIDGQGKIVADEAQQTGASLGHVVSASNELAVAISDIGKEAAHSEGRSKASLEQASEAVARIARLKNAAEKISQVATLITEIAGKTNLLALNATIEAARAGEAGKGFAVVAAEVKRLSQQTAKATEDVIAQILEIQGATAATIATIETISASVGEVYATATSIAASVAQQSAATQAINRNIDGVAANTTRVEESAREARNLGVRGAEQATAVGGAAASLAAEASVLSREVGEFLEAIKTLKDGDEIRLHAVDAEARIRSGGRETVGKAVAMSSTLLVVAAALEDELGTLVDVDVTGLDRPLRARFAGAEGGRVFLQLPLKAEHRAYMNAQLRRFAA